MCIRDSSSSSSSSSICSRGCKTFFLSFLSFLVPVKQSKMASLNDEALAEAHGEMMYWDDVYRRSGGFARI